MMPTTQYEKIVLALRRWCSPADAFYQAGTMKLSTRCGELEAKGFKIERKWGPKKAFKLYRLAR